MFYTKILHLINTQINEEKNTKSAITYILLKIIKISF